MTIVDMIAWRAARESERLARLNEHLDMQLAAIARARGMTVQALEEEYLDEMDAMAEADPEFQLWNIGQQLGGTQAGYECLFDRPTPLVT